MGESRDIIDESQYQWFIIVSVGYCVGNACGLIIYTLLHTGTFIFMYRAQEIKCRLHGREWNKRFSWSGEAAREREEIDFACYTTASSYWRKLRKPICSRDPFSFFACVTRSKKNQEEWDYSDAVIFLKNKFASKLLF